jgi:hypothetical protein
MSRIGSEAPGNALDSWSFTRRRVFAGGQRRRRQIIDDA